MYHSLVNDCVNYVITLVSCIFIEYTNDEWIVGGVWNSLKEPISNQKKGVWSYLFGDPEKKMQERRLLSRQLEISQQACSSIKETERIPQQVVGSHQQEIQQSNTTLQETQSQLQELNTRLQETQSLLHKTQTQLQESDTRLQETQSLLRESDARLQETQSLLQESDTRLQDSQQQLQVMVCI